jgi:hypothetical protein
MCTACLPVWCATFPCSSSVWWYKCNKSACVLSPLVETDKQRQANHLYHTMHTITTQRGHIVSGVFSGVHLSMHVPDLMWNFRYSALLCSLERQQHQRWDYHSHPAYSSPWAVEWWCRCRVGATWCVCVQRRPDSVVESRKIVSSSRTESFISTHESIISTRLKQPFSTMHNAMRSRTPSFRLYARTLSNGEMVYFGCALQ